MTRDARLVHGVQLHRTGRLNEAAELYKELLLEFPLDTLVLNNLATAMFQLGNIAEGLPLVQQSLEIDPDQPLAEYNKGKALLALNRTTEAMASFESAIRLKPDLTDAHNDKGLVLQSMGRHSEAIECFDRALARNESFTALNNRGCSLRALGKLQDGLADVDRAAQLQPAVPEIHKNRGDILRELRQFESAIECYDLAIKLRPNYSEAYNNKGLALKELHRLDEALEAYDRAIGSKHNAEASFNRGWILEQQKKYAESLASYQRAVAEKPDIDYGLGNILAQKMRIFDWQGVNELRAEIVTRIGSGLRSAPPFIVLAFSDSLEIQRKAAKIWIDDRDPLLGENQPLPPFQGSTERKQLTIGYFSADFRMHPVSYLTAGLYEHHDRSRFRIYAFSSGPNTGDPLSQRVRRAFDHFIDIRAMSDLEVVNLARAAKIDIAVDLGGLTQDCRTGIFARRAAPIQVNYLGYPGTLGATFMDYILGDKFLIPDAVRDFYSEKVVQLPVFQANDDRRSISSRVFSKRELRIPDESFAFCCLNNSLKITPEVFF